MAEIGLGLAALGRPGYVNVGHGADLGEDRSVAALEARCHTVLDAAHAGGVRYFDAARSYGRAEDFLGSWLAAHGIAPGAVTVASKWGYTYTADWRVDADPPEVKDHSVGTFRRQLAETRRRLGEHLDLYQIHSATRESGVLEEPAVLAALAELRARGVRIGFTTSGPAQAETIDRALELGGFDAVQATWNLLEPSAGPALARAHEAGLAVIVKEALANGRLTERAGGEPGIAERALAAALAQPWADVVLSGAATVEHLHANLAARDVGWTGDPEALAEPPEAYWERRSAMTWT
jgi:aryl-alcohol dehydrogenase-like predicted oxidoreductase